MKKVLAFYRLPVFGNNSVGATINKRGNCYDKDRRVLIQTQSSVIANRIRDPHVEYPAQP